MGAIMKTFKYILLVNQMWTVSGLQSQSSTAGIGDSSSLRRYQSKMPSKSSFVEIRSDSPNEFSDSNSNSNSHVEGSHVQVEGADLRKVYGDYGEALDSNADEADVDVGYGTDLVLDDGLTFSRSINIQTDALDVHFEFDSDHCDSSDKYGDNNCHYSWGETLRVGIAVNMTEPFTETDRVYASMKVDYFVPWKLDCAVCGEDCTMKIPVVEFEIKLPMLPCPLAVEDIPTVLEIPLGDTSPFAGVPLHAAGDIYLKRESSDVLAWGHVVVDVQ